MAPARPNLPFRLANRALDVAFLPGTEPLWLRRRHGRVMCLLYHRVADPSRDPYAFLTRGGLPATAPAELEWDLRYLARLGARFMTFAQILSGEFPPPDEFGIVVAFDDCFADNHSTGRDILKAVGIKATFFQTSGLIDGSVLIWEHALYWYSRNRDALTRLHSAANAVLVRSGHAEIEHAEDVVPVLRESTPYEIVREILDEAATNNVLVEGLPELPGALYPTSEQVRTTSALGHDIGCHGHQHLKRATITADLFREDVEHACDILGSLLGAVPRAYAFPFSSHMPGDEAICRQASFEMAATVERNRDITWPLTYYVPRFTWPGPARNSFRRRRWLLTGTI